MIKKFDDIRDCFFDHDLFLTFSGPMSQDLLVEMGEILKTKMKLEGAGISTILNAFSILVELNQNIIHYSAETITTKSEKASALTTGCGIIAIGSEGGHYFILSGNVVMQGDAERLGQIITDLNDMEEGELKQLYKEKRKQGPDETSKGAGLGFIEIARKTSTPMTFDFTRIDAERSFFSLKAVI